MKTLEKSNLFNVAEVTVGYRNKVKSSDRPKVTSSKAAFDILFSHWDVDNIGYVEEFKILLLNKANRVIGIKHISSGGTASCVVDPKLVFQVALKCNAAAIILSHNHPSGNTTPSQADHSITKRIAEGGKLLDIEVLDHIIVTPESTYYSFSDNGSI